MEFQKTFLDLPAGEYQITEQLLSDWELDAVNCTGGEVQTISNGVNIELSAGKSVSCVFKNEKYSEIVIQNSSAPALGDIFEYSGDLGVFTLVTGESHSFSNLTAGDYLVSKYVLEGWKLSDFTCDGGCFEKVENGVLVHLAPGEKISCSFSNVKVGSITINQETTYETGVLVSFWGI